jgi:PTH2 family peptidyl-tRNA hydrolase
MSLKQVILVRDDLKLPKGKLAGQVAHASVEAVLKSDKDMIKKWRQDGSAKIVLKVETKADLFKYNQIAKDSGLITALISDAGRTVISPGTETTVAIGPDEEDKIDSITGSLKLV